MQQRPEDLVVKPRHPVRTFFRFFAMVGPHWHRVLLQVLLDLLNSPLPLLVTLLGRVIIDNILLNTAAPTDERIYNLLLLTGAIAFIQVTNLALVGGGFFDMYGLTTLMSTYVGNKIRLVLRRRVYTHLHRLPLGFFQRRTIGEHVYRMLNDTGPGGFGPDAAAMVTRVIPDIINIINQTSLALVYLTALNPTLGLAIIIYTVPKIALMHTMMGFVQRRFFLIRERDQMVTGVLRESISGSKTLKSFGQTRWEARKYVRLLMQRTRHEIALRWLNDFGAKLHEVLELFVGVGLYGYIGYKTMQGQYSIGQFVVMMTIIRGVPQPLISLVGMIQVVRMNLVAAERILQTLDVPVENGDIEKAVRLPKIEGHIELKNVEFSYPDGTPVLRGINLSIAPGESVAFVGPSGEGKSTLLNLLLRLYRPTAGSIHVDGVDLNDLRIADLTKATGTVLQETHMFLGSIETNLKFGWPLARREELVAATRIADIHEFIEGLPEGYATDVREGARMSGGQRQRMGIARALVGRPRILLFDEPTSNLDTATESEVWSAMREAMKGRTSIIVTHRLPTARHADRIAVLSGGRIAEMGTHAELMKKSGVYAAMWAQQFHGGQQEVGQ